MKRLSESRSLPAVFATTRSTAADASGVRRDSAPNTRTRTPRWCSSSASRATYSSSSDMSAVISVGGRCQFSWENANSESSSSPTSTAPATTSRTARIPDRCPNGLGMRRSRAQRPFPSMMIATCRGTAPCTRICASRSASFVDCTAPSDSDFHDLGFLVLQELVDLVHVFVVEFLQILLSVLHVVFAHAVQLLEVIASHRAGMPNGNPTLLRQLVHDLHQLLPALLVHHGQRDAD